MKNPFGPAFWRGFGGMMLYGGVHSLLASSTAKAAVARRIGRKNGNTLYRIGYNAFALPTFVWLLYRTWKKPGETVYEVRGTAKRLLWLVGTIALTWALWGAWQIGIGRLSGVNPALRRIQGNDEPDPPEGQNPTFAKGAPQSGPFSRHRHPLNFAIPIVFWSYSRGSQSFIGLNLALTLYAICGSYLTDARMKTRYGRTYQRYAKRVPLLWPKRKDDR